MPSSFLLLLLFLGIVRAENNPSPSIEFHNLFIEDKTINLYFSLFADGDKKVVQDTSCTTLSCTNLFSVLLDSDANRVEHSKVVFVDDIGSDTLILVDRTMKSLESWKGIQKAIGDYLRNQSERDRVAFGVFSKTLRLVPDWDMALNEVESQVQKERHSGKTTESFPFSNALFALKKMDREPNRFVNVLLVVDGFDASKVDTRKYEKKFQEYCSKNGIPFTVLSLDISPPKGFVEKIGDVIGLGPKKKSDLIPLQQLPHFLHRHRDFVRKSRLLTILPRESDQDVVTVSVRYKNQLFPYSKRINNPVKTVLKSNKKDGSHQLLVGVTLVAVSIVAIGFWGLPFPSDSKLQSNKSKSLQRIPIDLADFKRSNALEAIHLESILR